MERDFAPLADLFAQLASLERRRAALLDAVAAELRAPSLPDAQPLEVVPFIRGLRGGSSQLVARTVARASKDGRVLSRQELRDQTRLSEERLRGATGDLGRAWSKSFRGRPNPFLGRQVFGTADHEYSIPIDLAEQILAALEGS